jgi:pimeloyl-ACP methyl ester carboxylesterase
MGKNASDVVNAPERRVARSVHYNISYIVQGEQNGPDGAIVLLHDILGGAFAWENVLPQLAGLKRAVYAFDMLGYGASDHPWPADTSIWGQGDVLAYLLKHLGLTNIVLVGHGFGGGVAQVLATRLYRHEVAAIVLIDSTSYLHAFAANWPLPDMAKRQDVDAPKETKIEDILHDLRETLPGGVQNTKGFADVIEQYIKPWDSEVGKEVLYQHIRQMIPSYSNSVSTDLTLVEKPLLIIWGERDEQMPLKQAERLHRDVHGSQLVVVPGAGHLILFDAPGAVGRAIVDFLS